MVMLGIVGGIGEEAVEAPMRGGLFTGRGAGEESPGKAQGLGGRPQ